MNRFIIRIIIQKESFKDMMSNCCQMREIFPQAHALSSLLNIKVNDINEYSFQTGR